MCMKYQLEKMAESGNSGSQPKKHKTRQDSLQLHKVSAKWAELVGNGMLHNFSGTKLPDNRSVMLHFHTLKCNSSYDTNHTEYSKISFSGLKEICLKSYIPMVDDYTCLKRIQKLLNSWTTQNCRLMKSSSAKQIAYTAMVDELWYLAPSVGTEETPKGAKP